MNLKDNNYTLEFAKEDIRAYEERVLSSGLCDFAIPMRFTLYRGKRRVRYECSGYMALSDLEPSGVENILEIIERTLIMLKRAKEFLIDPDKVTLTKETVFYNARRGDVKIAYIVKQRSSVQSNMVSFIYSFMETGDKRTRDCLDKLSHDISMNNLSLEDSIDRIGEIKRETRI